MSAAKRHQLPRERRHPLRRYVLAVTTVFIVAASGVAWWTTRTVLGDITVSRAAGTNAHPKADGPITVLLIGLDSRKDQDGNDLPAAVLDQLHAGDSDSGGYNTNTLVLAHVDADDHVVAFSIPRDDYVAVHDIPGYDHIKIKEAYGLAKADKEQRLVDGGDGDQADLERRGRDAGRTATLAAVRDLTGVTPDYFAEVNLAGFYGLAQAVGGVDVCLNSAVQDDYSGADFPAGKQRLQAAQALAFVRQRHGLTNGDIDRTHRQQAFLTSVLSQLSDAGTFTDLGRLGKLLDVVRRNVVLSTGWTPEMFDRIGDIARTRAVEYHTLPVVRYDEIDGSDVNIVDPAAIKAQVSAAMADHSGASAEPSGGTTVDVINATTTDGLAGRISDTLTTNGFTAGDVRSALPGESTVTTVVYGQGAADDAQAIARIVHVDDTSGDDRIPAGHVVVTLGPGYDPDASVTETGHTTHTTGKTTGKASSTVQTAAAPDTTVTSANGTPCVD